MGRASPIPAEQIPTLFGPFARAEHRVNSSDGVGLGLSIASAIARVHNATITARPRPSGGVDVGDDPRKPKLTTSELRRLRCAFGFRLARVSATVAATEEVTPCG